jgi:hypothetical protein
MHHLAVHDTCVHTELETILGAYKVVVGGCYCWDGSVTSAHSLPNDRAPEH